MTQNGEGVMALDKLKDHYKHCIRLSASNKINHKNAFDLQLIDYMQDLVSSNEDGLMNFKIASSALDVGAKIYSSRVDCIQSEAQKVASSILMALDGKKHDNSGDDLDNTQADSNVSGASDRLDGDGEDGAQSRATKKRARKNVKTVVEDETLLDAKLEQMVLGDPFLDGLAQDYDMSCPAALISFNALTQPNCLLTIESNNLRKDYTGETSASMNTNNFNKVTLITKAVNCAQIIRNNQNNQICPRLQNFLFNDPTTTISGLNANLDDTSVEAPPVLNSSRQFGGEHEFNPEQYDNDAGHDDFSDAGDNAGGNDADDEIDLIPDLDKIAASKPSEYGYSNEHHRLKNTWAGPFAWKVAKAPQTVRKDGAPKSARKRVKLEQMPIDWADEGQQIDEDVDDRKIRHSADVLRRWKTVKLFRPQDHNFTEESTIEIMAHTFLRPEDTYHCAKTPADALKTVDKDHDYANRSGFLNDEAPNSPGLGGFDDVHDDSDDEFRADPVVEGNEVAIYGAVLNTSLNQLEFAGEHLIEQPYTVTQVVIPFAKIAKKMDIRKLKHVMWNLLSPEDKAQISIRDNNVTVIENGNDMSGGDQTTIIEAAKKTPSPTPSEKAVHLAFSNLYGNLPVRVSSKMANDLSQPIAFVTLLHLANEKNLKLIPEIDLRDFIIEQDQLV